MSNSLWKSVALCALAACVAATLPHASVAAPSRTGHAAASEGYVTVEPGVRLYYQKTGSGPRTVIVPARLFLVNVVKRLGPGVTVIAYDMRNRGRSDAVADGSRITIQADVEDLEVIRRHFGVERFSTIGYSYLGMMVVMYAMKHPQRVERLVQIGPVPLKWDTPFPKELTANDTTPVVDPEAEKALEAMRAKGLDVSEPKRFCEQDRLVYRASLVGDPTKADQLEDVCDMPNEWPVNLARHFQFHFEGVKRLVVSKADVARVTVPVLTIHGTKDRNAPYGAGREWATLLPNARLLTVKGAAHAAWIDAPDLVFSALNSFLRGDWPAEAAAVRAGG
jgi:proline iminopeptidase